MANNFTEEELDNLTDEERSAITDDEATSDDEVETVADVEESTDTETEVESEEGEESDEAEADEEESTQDDEVDADDEAESSSEEDKSDDDQAADNDEPEQEAKLSLSDRMKQIDEELDSLGQKIEDGDIDFVEYNKSMLALNRERQDIVVDMRDERNAANKQAEDWNSAVEEFIAEDDGHKVILNNAIVKNAFQAALQEVSNSKDAAGKSNNWRLTKAKELLGESGISLGAKVSEKPKKPSSRKPDVDLPKTLADVGSAESNDNSEFSSLDGLDGVEFEEALAKLSPDQQDRYLGVH